MTRIAVSSAPSAISCRAIVVVSLSITSRLVMWLKPRLYGVKHSDKAWRALLMIRATERLSEKLNMMEMRLFDKPSRSLHRYTPTAVRIDRCEEFRKLDDEETIPTISSNESLERPVKIGYSLSDNSWTSSKLNRRFELYIFRKLPKSVSTSLLFHSWYRTDRGLTASSALFVKRR